MVNKLLVLKANVEQQPRFGKETLKRSVRVSTPRSERRLVEKYLKTLDSILSV